MLRGEQLSVGQAGSSVRGRGREGRGARRAALPRRDLPEAAEGKGWGGRFDVVTLAATRSGRLGHGKESSRHQRRHPRDTRRPHRERHHRRAPHRARDLERYPGQHLPRQGQPRAPRDAGGLHRRRARACRLPPRRGSDPPRRLRGLPRRRPAWQHRGGTLLGRARDPDRGRGVPPRGVRPSPRRPRASTPTTAWTSRWTRRPPRPLPPRKLRARSASSCPPRWRCRTPGTTCSSPTRTTPPTARKKRRRRAPIPTTPSPRKARTPASSRPASRASLLRTRRSTPAPKRPPTARSTSRCRTRAGQRPLPRRPRSLW